MATTLRADWRDQWIDMQRRRAMASMGVRNNHHLRWEDAEAGAVRFDNRSYQWVDSRGNSRVAMGDLSSDSDPSASEPYTSLRERIQRLTIENNNLRLELAMRPQLSHDDELTRLRDEVADLRMQVEEYELELL